MKTNKIHSMKLNKTQAIRSTFSQSCPAKCYPSGAPLKLAVASTSPITLPPLEQKKIYIFFLIIQQLHLLYNFLLTCKKCIQKPSPYNPPPLPSVIGEVVLPNGRCSLALSLHLPLTSPLPLPLPFPHPSLLSS